MQTIFKGWFYLVEREGKYKYPHVTVPEANQTYPEPGWDGVPHKVIT